MRPFRRASEPRSEECTLRIVVERGGVVHRMQLRAGPSGGQSVRRPYRAIVNGDQWHCTWNDIELLSFGSSPPRPRAAVDVYCEGDYKPEVETFSRSEQAGRLDIVRIYESRSDHHGSDYHPMGDVKVSIDNHSTTTLVLSSYEPTRWHVGGPGEASLRRIIVTGYQEQDVVAPQGVQIERHVGSSQWWELGSIDGPSGKDSLIAASTEAAQAKPSTISYCYRANAFSLR